MPLQGKGSPGAVCHEPEGMIIWMSDRKKGVGVRVLVLFNTLIHGEEAYSIGNLDKATGRELLEKNRQRIEQAASRKYDAKGMDEHQDGMPILIV